MSAPRKSAPVVPGSMLVPFILVTILFPLWGFANDITNPMVAAFKNILLLTNFESSLVQAAFYGGYALMAIPAAIFIKKFSYKKGILLGLTLYAVGCLLFIPSGWSLTFAPFLLAYLIMTCGLSFLETTANPYILSMGDEATATRRLNLAQAFNPMGSIIGMFVASMVILTNLNGTSENGRRLLKGVSDGETMHAQITLQQIESAEKLSSLLNKKQWNTKKSNRLSAVRQSGEIADKLQLLSKPQPKRAEELAKRIAAEPREAKITQAVNAILTVVRIRDERPPSPAEVERNEDFGGAAGLETALLLAQEERALGDRATVVKEALGHIAVSAEAASSLNQELGGITSEDSNFDDKSIREKMIQIRGNLHAGLSLLLRVQPATLDELSTASDQQFTAIQKSDLDIVVGPYAIMGAFLLVVLVLFAWKLPHDIAHEGGSDLHFGATLGRLIRNGHYLWGVVAQTFYVGAQIMCWTFIIQYAELELGLSKSTAQNCNILAMIIFVSSRFICTFMLHYVKPGVLLAVLAVGGLLLTLGTVFIHGYPGLYCLIGVSACMSLMFPTIYGIALEGLGDDAKLASAGLILAIGGGCLMPPLQGAIIDLPPINFGFMELASVRASFLLPALCFVVIAFYGMWVSRSVRKSAV